MNTYPNERECEHGQLRRVCNICELEQEIEQLRTDAERYRYLRNRDTDHLLRDRPERDGAWITCEVGGTFPPLTAEGADAFIDAARGKT
jgi:hypothetical protein